MNYNESFLLKILTKNIFLKNKVKKILPKKIISKLGNLATKDKSIRLYFEDNRVVIDYRKNKYEGVTPVFYWDRVENFGDTIGPFLISKITKKPVLNICDTESPGLMTVGSIIQSINRSNMVIWGSGLIDTPSDELNERLKKYNPMVLSVRGQETARCLSQAGVKVPNPETYGDPALILPLFYKPTSKTNSRICICPHYSHKKYFDLKSSTDKSFRVVDVQSDMKSVIDEISCSKVCVSTSLHGLIIAQAYGVPWVWLEIIDKNLPGADFKFNDFFSTITKSEVSHIKVNSDEIGCLDFNLVSSKASLPKKLYNEKMILESIEGYFL